MSELDRIHTIDMIANVNSQVEWFTCVSSCASWLLISFLVNPVILSKFSHE